MGLDSVELLVTFEEYFGIGIPDAEAETIFTVQDMVDIIAKHLDITDNSEDLKNHIFQNIKNSTLVNPGIALTDNISAYISPQDHQTWSALEHHLQLNIPRPATKTGIFTPLRDYEWEMITAGQFVDVICAHHFKALTSAANIKSKYEIYIIVMGITADKTGVDYYDILPNKSFTGDFGID
ncbi:hypothetical protein [Chitinophaga sp.]|uniref:hypothetical protein n=1 Tax=Chitinophaga sp. TaxID=1869181 RepID=UPI002C930EF7|nr:hypothetical protein [Chitinophaga sp.]HWV66817.1 hypothetical protein [Chitinophaga sp.]